ncbi:class II fructose-bisphosphate aldolase [Candidatus Woesearchaeota archaeon]|nr:class II fructose-bisphosphate aldolase [Candidatus Woesearchaeota archaeon]
MRRKIIKLYRQADKQGFAIGAFNFSTNEILKGIISGAMSKKAPIIISMSEGERAYFGCEESVAAYKAIFRKYPHVVLHADHTKTFEEIKKVVDAGYPSVHFDGSRLEYDENLKQTKQAARYAHRHGVFIEGELGGITGGSTTHTESLKDVIKEDMLTKPEQAKEYVKKTKVDSLAISIGNAHGLWKEQKKLDFDRLKAIKQATGKFLVLHGGSGTLAEDYQKAIELGMNKININTDVRVAFARALLQGVTNRKDDVPYHYLGEVSKTVARVVEDKIIIFKSDNKI